MGPVVSLKASANADTPLPQHHLCAAHFRRNKVRRTHQLRREAKKRGWGAVVMELKALEALLRAPPWLLVLYVVSSMPRRYQQATPPRQGKQASWGYRVKTVLLEILEKAPTRVTGETNNRTEQVIGRAFRVRTRTMRGQT